MRGLSAPDLVTAWEQGSPLTDNQRADLLLRLATNDGAVDPADLSIGRRDARLLHLRRMTYGERLNVTVDCLACHEHLEMILDVESVRVRDENSGDEDDDVSAAPELLLKRDGYEVRARAPTGADVDALLGLDDIVVARRVLLERCILSALHDGDPVAACDLPEPIVEAVAERLNSVDPQADVALAMTCPVCEHDWETGFDVARFFWQEIEIRVPRLLDEVDLLASAYGWHERDILAMGPRRRRYYLAKVVQ